jgi:hypothetical protein
LGSDGGHSLCGYAFAQSAAQQQATSSDNRIIALNQKSFMFTQVIPPSETKNAAQGGIF